MAKEFQTVTRAACAWRFLSPFVFICKQRIWTSVLHCNRGTVLLNLVLSIAQPICCIVMCGANWH